MTIKQDESVAVFAALAQPTRLDAFRLLVRHEPAGLLVGEVARQLKVPQNTMSVHLGILSRAGLVSFARHGRSIVYRASIDRVREIASFLVRDCCGGRAELCAPLIAEFTPCCTPMEQGLARESHL
jgi:ArsR family transcriptional regulator, arsenate/arsenite/antimonite-responsive transcriptional repressor